MSIQIVPVRTRADRQAFARFPWRVYRHDPNWVPPILAGRKAYLKRRASFFQHGEADFYLARRAAGDRPVLGTIGLAVDHTRNRHLGERRAIFGFFDVLPGDAAYPTASALWDHAVAWSHHKGMTVLNGPYSFAYNDEPGFLVEGHAYPPTILMGHTPPTYAVYAERYGFVKHADSLAYRIDFADYDYDPAQAPPLLLRVAERARKRLGAGVVRTARLDDWDAEIERAMQVYNRSLGVLEDFTPMREAQFRQFANQMRRIVDPDMILFAEMDGQTVGFAVGLPNIMEALRYANGLQMPWDYLRFLWHRRRVTGVSYKIMAIDPDYWARGIDALMYMEIAIQATRKGYTWLDGSLTAETNPTTNKVMRRFGMTPYKRYRVFKLPVAP